MDEGMKGYGEGWEGWRKDESDDVWTRGPSWPLLQCRCPRYRLCCCWTQVQSGFRAVSDRSFLSCGLFSVSSLIYFGCVSVFFLRSCYFAWDWHERSLDYVEITGIIVFIALLSIDECPAGYWLYAPSNWIYMLLRNVVQYKYNKKSNISNNPDKFAPNCGSGQKEGIGLSSHWLGLDFCSVLALTKLIVTAVLIYIFLQLLQDKKAVQHNSSAWNLISL